MRAFPAGWKKGLLSRRGRCCWDALGALAVPGFLRGAHKTACTHVYIYMSIEICKYIYRCVHTYMNTCKEKYLHIYIYICKDISLYVYTYASM